ncbi:MAG: phage tail protein [Cyclobacteriaceae bacterium]
MALHYPPVGFNFLVRFEGLETKYPGIPDVGFQSVEGLSTEVGVEEYSEGGENRYAHRMPNPVSYGNLTMKRGLLIGSSLIGWFRDATELFEFEAHDVLVMLLNRQLIPIQAWNFINAWPVKWDIEGMNAEENGIMAESIEFTYQYFRRLDPTTVSI